MTIEDVCAFLRGKAPEESAEAWDNPGLLVAGRGRELSAVLVTLDVTPAALEEAEREGAGLIVSHHPVIFEPLRRLDAEDMPYRLAAAGIAAYAAHTNLDKAPGGVNDVLAARLHLEQVTAAPDGLCRVGCLPAAMEARDFARLVARQLKTPVRACGEGLVRRVGLCGGAGGDEWAALRPAVDAFVTGEVKHHQWLAARQAGVVLVDAGHYATEVGIVDTLEAWLKEAFPALRVIVHRGDSPYAIIDSSGKGGGRHGL